MLLSIGLHLTLFVLGWASTMYEPVQMEFITYEIELVSPPPTRQAEVAEVATEELVIERPEPEPAPPEPPTEDVVPIEKPLPEPDPPPPTPEKPREVPPETAEESRVAAAPTEPVREEAESGEGLNVRIEGLRRDYPEYYNNIILQIRRCLRWAEGGSWQTTVFFNIDRQGLASDIEFVTRSGNVNFDFQSMGAIECAGRGRFGPLPAELPYELFPVRFTIRSGGEHDALLPDFEQARHGQFLRSSIPGWR